MNNYTYKQQKLLDYLAKGKEYQRDIFSQLEDIHIFTIIYKNNYFSSQNNPIPIESEKDKGFFTIPYWPALTYLEKISRHCSSSENKQYAEKLMEIIREVTRPDGDRNKRADNWRTWQSFVKIMANLPFDIVKTEDIDLIANWLNSKFDTSMVVLEISKTLLPKLLQADVPEGKKASRILEIILDSVKFERRHSMATHSLQEIFKLNATLLGEKWGKDVIEVLRRKIEGVDIKKDDNYCYVWRPAIEDSKQNVGKGDNSHILISGLRDVFLSYASAHDAVSLIEACFKSEKYIIRRFSLYIFDKLFDKYKPTAEKIILETGKDIFLKSNYHHELYLFIIHHFTKLSSELQSSLINVISQLSGDWRDDVDKERLDAMLRRRWLYAVKVSGYSIPNELEEKYFKDIDYKPEHPEFLSYIGPVSWGDESLFSANELLAQGSINDIISFLNTYEGKNRFGEPAVREAGQSLKEAIRTKQEFFESGLIEFKKAKCGYWYYVIQAFEELVQDKKEINWDRILEFCQSVVDDEILWNGEEKESHFPLEPKKSWIPAVIADLIKKGVQNDELVLSDANFTAMDWIIRVLLDNQVSTASGKDDDALTEAINTTKGHVLECFKSYTLRRYRDYDKLPDKGAKQKETFWKEIETLFNRELERTKEGNFEFSSLAGAYLPNLYYLNKAWVEENINRIFSTEDEKHWRCAMQGYSYVNTIYAVIYNLLKNNGHLKRALDTKFSSDQTKKRVIENVAVSYLEGQEAINCQESLFKYILDRWYPDDIEEIISLFWAHRDVDLDYEQRGRIFDFWRYCFNRIKGKEDENKDVLSDLNLLAVFFDQLSEEQKDWLEQSVLYVEERYHSSFLLEYLDKLAGAKPKEVGDVMLKMLAKTTPSFQQENIQSILEKIYKAGLRNEIANPICDRYARAGFKFLTEIYKKYNQD